MNDSKNSNLPNLYVALLHYPVVNKNGDVIASAVTNLDLHDIARAAKTYGIKSFYVVTPLADQKALVEKIVSHWTEGLGARYNPTRREALKLIRTEETLEKVYDDIRNSCSVSPKTVVTSAKNRFKSISYGELRGLLKNGKPYLLLMGTAWGLSDGFIAGVDYVLAPIKGTADYNHLSVRSATAVILDRLLANET
ncbi:MAG: RNA methyltransferase [Thermodesulfobacteriota bacterium]|nr:RNA methyltransferase [Thermodesulfobacteriota bacterium]